MPFLHFFFFFFRHWRHSDKRALRGPERRHRTPCAGSAGLLCPLPPCPAVPGEAYSQVFLVQTLMQHQHWFWNTNKCPLRETTTDCRVFLKIWITELSWIFFHKLFFFFLNQKRKPEERRNNTSLIRKIQISS